MRALFALLFAACVGLADAAAQSNLIGERDTARPGGVYTQLTISDAFACARACAEDNICLAWTLRAGTCELKAVAPAPIAETGAISGLSSRAPEFVRRVARLETASISTPAASSMAEPVSLLGGPLPVQSDILRPRLGESGPVAP